MDGATVAELGSGEPMVMRDEADMVQAAKQGPRGAAKMQIRARIVHVGSEYRRDVTSGTCELCITDWSARIRDITFEFAATDGSATWQETTPTLHVGRWNDVWEVCVNPFALSKALRHVALTVDAGCLADARGRTRIALEILEAVERLDRASAMVERLDGAYLHNDDWDEEVLPWLTWNSGNGSDPRG